MVAVDEGARQESLMIPPSIVPPFVREIGKLAQGVGMGRAVVEVCGDAHITFEVEGGESESVNGRGVLIASDHQQTVEPWFSQGLMGVMGRTASHIIGKPSSLQCRLIHHISDPDDGLILPVIPGTFAAEKKGSEKINNDLVARLQHPSLVRPRRELDAINTQSMQRAAALLKAGQVVTIYPTGTTHDAAQAPWRRGLGVILCGLSSDVYDMAQVVVLRPERVSKGKLIAALTLRGLGIRPRPQTVVLRIANVGTPKELLGEDLTLDDPGTPQRLTDRIRERYLTNLT